MPKRLIVIARLVGRSTNDPPIQYLRSKKEGSYRWTKNIDLATKFDLDEEYIGCLRLNIWGDLIENYKDFNYQTINYAQ